MRCSPRPTASRVTVDGGVMHREKRHQPRSDRQAVRNLIGPDPELSSMFGPNVVAIATSDASRPRAIRTRPDARHVVARIEGVPPRRR